MGAIKDFVTGETYISTTNLDEGITPDEFKYYCDMSIAGTHGRAIETQDGKLYSLMFHFIFLSAVFKLS